MTIAVSASIATDHLMRFPGRFSDVLLADQLQHVSLSFLVDDLVIRRGGVAGNIAYAMGVLGCNRCWSARSAAISRSTGHGWRTAVSTARRSWSPDRRTPRASSAPPTRTMAQIASFYPGAMSEARDISIAELADRPASTWC